MIYINNHFDTNYLPWQPFCTLVAPLFHLAADIGQQPGHCPCPSCLCFPVHHKFHSDINLSKTKRSGELLLHLWFWENNGSSRCQALTPLQTYLWPTSWWSAGFFSAELHINEQVNAQINVGGGEGTVFGSADFWNKMLSFFLQFLEKLYL